MYLVRKTMGCVSWIATNTTSHNSTLVGGANSLRKRQDNVLHGRVENRPKAGHWIPTLLSIETVLTALVPRAAAIVAGCDIRERFGVRVPEDNGTYAVNANGSSSEQWSTTHAARTAAG